MSVIGAETRVATTYYWRCRFKAEIEFGTQRILFREVSKSTLEKGGPLVVDDEDDEEPTFRVLHSCSGSVLHMQKWLLVRICRTG